MKKEFLKIAGVEKESDFYKLFPTEEAFFGMYPEAKKLVQKAYGGLIKAQQGVEYKGPSVVDYLATKGYKGSKEFRKGLAQEYGVENYDYSAAKNTELLNKLRENQEILSQHEKSFSPVSVETIEQLHQKNKAGLDRHSSLPGKKEAKKDFDVRKFSTLLDIATMSAPSSLSAPIPSLRLSSGKATPGFKKQQSKPSDPIQEGEYDVQEKPQLEVQKQESPGFMDYLNLAGQLLPNLMPGSPAIAKPVVEKISNTAQQFKNWGQRQYSLLTGSGDDLSKTKSEIKIPTKKVSQDKNINSKLTIDGVPYAEGTHIDMDDKGSRYYTKPTWIDLNSPSLKLGARNRGSRLGNIKTEGFVITPFAKEYGTGYDDDGGSNTIRQYKDNEIVNDKIYGGVDSNGNFYLDYGKNLKGKNLQMADFRSLEVSGIAKNKSGRYIYGDATDNKRVARTAKAFDAEGKPSIDLNLLVPKKKIKTGHESFGQIGGGRYILATPDLSKKVLVAGSLKNIDQYIEDFKKSTGNKVVKMIPLDNGTFARGLSTKDGIITDDDQANYDNFNNKGGAAFYLVNKKDGGLVLPKAQWGGIGQRIGKNVLPFVQMMKQPTIKPLTSRIPTKQNTSLGSFSFLNNLFSKTPSLQKPFALDPQQFKPDNAMVQEVDEEVANQMMEQPTIKPVTSGVTVGQNTSLGQFSFPQNAPAQGPSLEKPFALDPFQFRPDNALNQETDEQVAAQFETTPTTTNYANFYNQSLKSGVIESPEGAEGQWMGDPNYDPTKTTAQPKKKKQFGEGLAKLSNALTGALSLGSFIASEIDYRKALKNQQKSLRNKLFTQTPMPQLSGFRGDYVTNTGAFRPDEYTVNKGMYVSNMPGARMAKFGGPIMQIGGGIMGEQLVTPEAEFSPIVAPEIPTSTTPSLEETEVKNYKHSGANPIVDKTWDEISKQYSGVKFLGIWGDESHKKRKSDHNTGNALDIGILNTEQGDKIAEQLISEADDKRIKYLIFNSKIWSPEKGWTKYNRDNPHTDHVHVSFYPYEGTKRKAGESLAVAHNNPGNIHFGDFTSQWGAEKGAYDNKGYVAKFNSIDEGWDAFNKLLFGPSYNNLTITQARNKWVTGKPNTITDSSKFIAKELGVDSNTPISELSADDKRKLASLFVKYEDNKMYKKMKDMKYFEKGGEVSYTEGEEYDLTEDQIRQILENGGDIEYI